MHLLLRPMQLAPVFDADPWRHSTLPNSVFDERDRIADSLLGGVICRLDAVGLVLQGAHQRVHVDPHGACDRITAAIRAVDDAIHVVRSTVFDTLRSS